MPARLKLSISSARKATDEEWDAIWNRCEYSVYFHSREWAVIWAYYTRGYLRPDPWLIEFSDKTKALLPFSCYLERLTDAGVKYMPSEAPRGCKKNFMSSPAGTYGGWISGDDISREHAELLVELLAEKFPDTFIRVNPYNEVMLASGLNGVHDDTEVLDLTRGYHLIYKGWTKGHRSAAQKASREGITVRLGTSIDDWREYSEIYGASLERWGDKATSRYGWKLFEEIYKTNSSRVKLWLACKDGLAVAGALICYSKRHAVYWHGAALDEYFNLRPVNLLIQEAIRDACENGYRWFDFNPSGGHEGVRAFKRSFGTRPLPCPIIRNFS
jgi:hypothetical protein